MDCDKDIKSTKHENFCRLYPGPQRRIWLEIGKGLQVQIRPPQIKQNIKLTLCQIQSRWPNQAKVLAEQEFHIGDGLEGLHGVPAPLQDHELETLRDCDRLFSVWWVKIQKFLKIM